MAGADDKKKADSDVPDFVIHDRTTFEACTNVDPIAKLYYFHVLDSLIDVAYAVAHDFYDRPELFTKPTGLTQTMARFHARYGTQEDMLNKAQRVAVYMPVLGAGPLATETGNFAHLRDELLAACVTYVESQFGDPSALRANVMQKHGLFKEYLTGIVGESVQWSARAIHTLAEQVAYPILRNETIAAVYGIGTKINDQWPYALDPNAPKAIEKMSQALSGSARLQPMMKGGAPPLVLSREIVTRLQRAAIEGTRAITTATVVGSTSSEGDIAKLIERCYTWANALRSLGDQSTAIGMVRAAVEPLFSVLKSAVGNGLERVRGG
jgi:hypothetical protein